MNCLNSFLIKVRTGAKVGSKPRKEISGEAVFDSMPSLAKPAAKPAIELYNRF